MKTTVCRLHPERGEQRVIAVRDKSWPPDRPNEEMVVCIDCALASKTT